MTPPLLRRSCLCHFSLLGLLAAAGTLAPLRAQEANSEVPIPPDLVEPAATYRGKESQLDEEISQQTGTARKAYVESLAPLIEKLQKSSNPHELDLVKKEVTRANEFGSGSAPDDALPVTVKSAWKNFLKEEDKIRLAAAPKRVALRASYQKTLAEVEKTYQTKGDSFAVSIVHRAKAATVIRTAVENNQLGVMGGPVKPTAVTDVVCGGGYLVGLDVGQHEFHGAPALGRALPIYATMEGEKNGKVAFGKGGSSGRIVAKEGYAIGGLNIRDHLTPGSATIIGSIQAIFMKINPDGLTLDPKDSYTSDWVGGDGNGKARELNCRGRVVVGMKNIPGDCVDAISLLFVK
ncbi:MAG: hypothetical protein JWO82_2039 [Akkermansiaceae bacterium]|nr:hypothetical protein [Akkermansiaceae bacterium]